MRKQYFVYSLANKRNGTLYTGMTGDVSVRTNQHKNGVVQGFTQKYQVHNLVYYEVYDSPDEAIRREKNIKAWQREWKLRLIESVNPEWEDLSKTLLN